MLKFAIHISTKNRCESLLETLYKTKHLLGENVECIVYDDGSTDGTSEEVQKKYPEIKVLRNDVSKGYLFCRNKMLNETNADFAISLDDDAHFLSENPIEIIEDFFLNNPKCGVIAARIFWNDIEPETNSTSDKTEIVQSFVGCGHVWNMKAWKEIPNYPEWYQFYGEESFASMQLFKKGWNVYYLPDLLVHHRVNLKVRSKSINDGSIRYKNALRADWYNYLIFLPLSKMPKRFGYSIWMQLRKVLKGNFKILKLIFLVKLDILKSFSTIIKNRNPFTKKEFQEFYQLKPAKIFWKPEK